MTSSPARKPGPPSCSRAISSATWSSCSALGWTSSTTGPDTLNTQIALLARRGRLLPWTARALIWLVFKRERNLAVERAAKLKQQALGALQAKDAINTFQWCKALLNAESPTSRARTTYGYDPFTSRMTRLLTRRNPAGFPEDCPSLQQANWPGCQIQNLVYTYDPAGNLTAIRDNAQQTIFFRNQRVEPSNDVHLRTRPDTIETHQ